MKDMFKKIIIAIVMILVILLLFFYPKMSLFKQFVSTTTLQGNPSAGFHEYKISVTHNGKPTEIGYTDSTYNNFTYGITVYNKSSICGYFSEATREKSSTYVFDSNTKVGDKTLKDYENEGYPFDVYVSAYTNDMGRGWKVRMVPRDAYDSTLNWEQLPKLSQDFSVNFDIPLFNISSRQIKISGKNASIHAELLDDWKSENDLYCVMERNYDAGDNSPTCPTKLSIFYQNYQCIQSYLLPECDNPNRIVYTVKAVRNGKNIDCIFPLEDLTSGKNYAVRIQYYEQMNTNLYLRYRSDPFIGTLSVP